MNQLPKPVFDRTDLLDFDLPAEGEDDNVVQLDVTREAAVKDKNGYALLTASEGWNKIREHVEKQKDLRIQKLLLEVITDANKDDLNFTRGEVSGMMLILAMADKLFESADDTLEVFREQEKLSG